MEAKRNVPIIIDTDLGDDIDDMWAIAYAALAGFDIRLITVCYTDIDYKLRCAQYMKDRLGLTCEIAAGVEVKQGYRPHSARVAGVHCRTAGLPAEDAIARVVADNEMTDIVAIGPMTNIGAFVQKYPDLKSKCRIVCMGGSIYRGMYGVDKPHGEYNLKSDLAASRAVLASGFETVYAALDVNRDFIIDGPLYKRMRASDNAVARLMFDLYDEWQETYCGYSIMFDNGTSTSILYDVTPLLYILDRALFTEERRKYSFDDNGKLCHDEAGRAATTLVGIKKELALRAVAELFL